MKGLQIFIDYLNNLGKKCQFDESEELEYDSIFNSLTKDYFDIKLEQFFTNSEKVGFTYDFNQQSNLKTGQESAGLFVTDADLNNFPSEGTYNLNPLVVKLCFMDQFINKLCKYSDLEDSIQKRKESNVDLIQNDLIELKEAIQFLIEELVRTSFVSQEFRDMTTLFFWTGPIDHR